jgi:hypothetical protein
MATVEDLARDVTGSLHIEEGYLATVRWINNRYQQLMNRVRFRQLRKIGEVQIPATYDTGTVAATRDSTTVTGTGTAWQTNIGSGAQEYWYIKIESAWYKISSVGGELAITLATNFSEDTVTANSYSAVKRHHALSANARWIGDFMLTRLRLPIPLIPLEQMDREAPGRILTDQVPHCVTQVGVDSSNDIMVEFYPYSDKSEIVHYVYWDVPSALTITSTLPAQIDLYMLKEGVLIDAYRYLKAKARKAGDHEGANSWRNDEFAQRTVWDRIIQDAVRADRGADDLTFILSMTANSRASNRGIINAHDHVYANWG